MSRFSKQWTLIYTIALAAFSLYAVLDTFVISSVYTVVDQEKISAPSAVSGKMTVHAKESSNLEDTTESGEKHGSRVGRKKAKTANRQGRGAQDGATESESTKAGDAQDSVSTKAGDAQDSVSTKAGDAQDSAEKSTSVKGSSAESKITLTQYRELDTDIYVAQIDTSSSVALRTAFARGAYGRNITEKTTVTAESVGAVLAINGDYYGAQEKGYVIRNGVLYRSEAKAGQEDLVIWQDGSFEIIREEEVTADELISRGAWQVLSFGPALLENGEIAVNANDEVDRAMQDNPRTAIGIMENGDYVMLVSDGRTEESTGLSLYELADFMKSLGVVTAYNLDGGGSSTMVYNNELINHPTTSGRIRERAVSDIVYIAY